MVAAIHQQLSLRDLLPRDHIVDAGYIDARGMVLDDTTHHIAMLGPIHADTNWQARQSHGYAAAAFDIQWSAQSVICPQGQPSAYGRARLDQTGHAVVDVGWSWKTCNVCPVLQACTRKQKGARTLKLPNAAEYAALHAARNRQMTLPFRTQYSARAGIEGTLAQTIRMSGLRRARYRGVQKTYLQQVFTATARNVVRTTDWLTQRPQRKLHKSAFARLVAAA